MPDDLTEEEKLEPVKNATADPRIRLLNRLYAKKRKVSFVMKSVLMNVQHAQTHAGRNIIGCGQKLTMLIYNQLNPVMHFAACTRPVVE